MAEQWWANDKPAPAAESSDNFWANDKPADAKPVGAIRKISDLGLGFVSGALGATKSVADAAGASNAVSGALDSADKFVQGGFSNQAVADQQEQQAILKESQGKGIYEGLKSAGKAFAVAPVQTAVTGLGSVVPTLLAGYATGGASVPVSLGAMATMGAAQGAGSIKGGIYDDIKQRSAEAGVDPQTAEAAALKAQEYAGPNTGQIALGAALGMGDSVTGVSKVATSMLRKGIGKGAQELVEGSTRGIAARTALGAAGEAPLETAQGGQQQYATNVASQREGFAVNPWDNVVSQGAFEGLASAGPGAAFGALHGKAAPTIDLAPAPATPDAPNPQLGFNPSAGTHTVFPDGSVVLNSDTPTGEQAVFDKRYAPQPIKPSEAMGLDPSAGPMSAVAVMAVDGGAHQTEIDKQNQALAQSTQAQSAIENIAPEIQLADIADPYEREHYLSFFDSADKNKGLAAIQANRYLETVLSNDNDIPDFDAASTMSDEDFLRFMGADEQEITNALTQSPTSTPTGNPSAFGNEANVAGDTGQGIGEVQSGQSGQGQVSGQPVDISALPATSSGAGSADASPSMESGMGSGAEDVRALGAGRAADQQNGGVVSPANGADAGAVIEGQANVQEPSTRTQAEPQTQAAGDEAPANAGTQPTQPPQGVSAAGSAGVEADGVARIDDAAHAAATSPLNNLPEPTQAQKKAGNYPKGHMTLNGLDLAIENPAGSVRRGKDRNGKAWENQIQHHYGYIKGTVGNDKDHVDLFVKPETPLDYSGPVFVVDQIHPDTGKFDEHKVIVGAKNAMEARQIYQSNYAKGWKGLKSITSMPFDEFKMWVKDGPKNKPLQPVVATPLTTQKDLADEPQANQTQPQQTQQQEAPAGAVAGAASEVTGRPTNWRGNFLQAAKVARDLKINPKGKKLAALVGEIEAHDAAQNTATTQSKRAAAAIENVAVDSQSAVETAAADLPVPAPKADADVGSATKGIGDRTVESVAHEIQKKVASNRRKYREKSRKEREAKGYAPNSTPESEQTDYDAEISETPGADKQKTAAALLGNDPVPLIGMFVNGNFEASEEVFKEMTGVRIRGLSAKDKKAALYKWAKWTPDQIAQAEQIAADKQTARANKLKEDDLKSEVMGAWLALGKLQVGETKISGTETGQEFVTRTIASGFDKAHSQKKGVATIYGLTNGKNFTTLKSGALTKFVKSVIAFGGLDKAMEYVNPPKPQAPVGFMDRSFDTKDAPAEQPAKTTPNARAAKQPSADELRAKAEPTRKIEDSGAVLEGARKLYAKAYAAKLEEGMGMDTASVPLSKSWPEPDYQRMLDDGADPWTVAFAHAARDEVPTKPSSSWKLKGWAEKVKVLRELAAMALDGKHPKDMLKEKGMAFHLLDWFNKVDLYEAVGHAESLKGVKFSAGQYGMYAGQTFKPAKTLWTINVPSTSAVGNWGHDLVVAETKSEAIEKYKVLRAAQGDKAPASAKVTTFDIYTYRSKPGFIVGKRISASKSIDLKTFGTLKEAREYKSGNQVELEQMLKDAKFEPAERRDANAPRVGVDHRNGADVSTEQFRDTFGFRGEQFGASMPQGERQSNLNQTYDSLMDLAGVVGVPPKALSLNGELGLAFGARGHGGKNPAAAHYEPDTTGAVTPSRVVINLTRKNGAGSLAHEWFHAVDNYFARAQGQKAGFMSERVVRDDGVRQEMKEAFRELMKTINLTGMQQRSKQLDKTRVKDYWSTGLEMAARSFESHVIAKLHDQNASNDYLANIVSEQDFARENAYPYPTAGELPQIRAAFEHFFDTVQTRSDEAGNVAMFSRSPKPNQTDTPAFKAWFGDSKVVDADGKPLVVYHGSKSRGIAQFKTAAVNTASTKRLGAHFTASPEFASTYGKSTTSAFLSIKNPLDITGMDAKDAIEALPVSSRLKQELRAAFRGTDYSQYGLLETAVREDLRGLLESAGHDGVRYTEGYADAFIVFEPEQIKSATGNNGNFEPTNPDIRFSHSAKTELYADRGPSQEDIRKTDELFRAARPKKSTVQDVRKAINQLVNGLGVLPNKLGRIVVATSEEIESNWVPLIGPVDIKSESEGDAQGFYNPKTRTVFLIADHINQGDEMGVVAHELMHKHGQDVLGKAGWDKLHGTIEGWKSADAASMERQVYDEAASRVKTSGAHLSNQELFPYAVQVALEMGVKPNAMAQEGTVARWLAGVRQALRQAWDKITNKPDQFKAQDMVNLAFGIAQMENPDHAPAMQRALDRQNAGAKQAGQRGTNAPVTNPKDVVGKSQDGRSADDTTPGVRAARQILEAIEQDNDFADYALRVIPGEFKGAIKIGDTLPASKQWENGNETDEHLDGTSAVRIRNLDEKSVIEALKNLGALGKNGPNGYYFGNRIALVKGESIGFGEDVGESIIKDAEVVGVWEKPSHGLSEINPNESTAPDSGGASFAGSNKSKQGTTADRAVMDMVREGRTAQDILKLIAGTSRSRFNKQVARLLLKTGVAPAVEMGGDLGGGGGFKFLAKYSPSEDVVTMTEGAQGQAEQIFMHEMVHAATIQALNRKGLASVQMRKLFEHVKKQGGAAGQYGMKNVREFASEAFTNPDFQRALKTMSAPSGSTFKTSWDGFVRILRGILGLSQDSTNALSQALDLGVAVMQEDKALRERGAARRGEQARGAVAEDEDANFGEAIKAITITDLKTKAGFKLADYRGLGLQFLGGRQINDLYAKDLPQLDNYTSMVQQMSADANDVGANADKVATTWGKLQDERQLAELMHDATLAQIDPAKDFVTGDNRLQWGKLNAAFKALTPEAQSVYTQARDGYEEHYANVREAIRDKIERSDLAKPAKAAMLERMDGEFFEKIKGVYFPLARFGKYVVVTHSPGGDVVNVSRAETLNEAENLRATMRKAYPGYTVGKVLKDKEFNAARDAVGRGFLKDLFGVLDKEGVGEELQDAVNQLYLASMPDLSWAKHGIHRKGTPGFSQDARRAYAQNMFHGARYLAKLRYADQLQEKLTDMQAFVDAKSSDEQYDSVKAQQVVDELNKRNDSLMNPKSNPLATALTSFGFVFHLGLSPASAMVNLSQTALVAYPVMGAKWGYDKAAAALTIAGKQAASNKNDISSALNPDERRAYDEAVRAGTIDVTNAHDLAGIAQGEDAGVMWKMRPVMKWASFLFHHAERFNRQITFVASYRLARAAGTDHQTAYQQATKATYDGHFDYASANRPRVMQGNAAKVLLLFKQFGQNMVYTLARQAQLAINAETPAGRKEARRALAGLLVMHASAAGVLGLPLVGTLLAAASMIGGSDDEPWDAEAALRNMLADTFGQKPAEVMARGVSRLTPWDVSRRVGLDSMILPDVQEGLQGKRLAESAMSAALGPVAGIGANVLKGMQEISEGRLTLGLETMMPAVLRGPMKALRYEQDGAKDKSGIVIKDEVSAGGIIGQALGFAPSEVRNATEGRSAIFSADKRLGERRSDLLDQYANAHMKQDAEGMDEARADIQKFNEKNPGRRINGLQLMQSVRNRQRRIDQAKDGIYLSKNRNDARLAGQFAVME